jgi:hypothetical protein
METTMKRTLTNNFHNTSVTLILSDGKTLSAWQVRKARRVLCGQKDCLCGDAAGCRPQQIEEENYCQGYPTATLIAGED